MFKKGNIVRFKCGFWGDIKSPETGKLGVIEYSYGERYGNGEISGGYSVLDKETGASSAWWHDNYLEFVSDGSEEEIKKMNFGGGKITKVHLIHTKEKEEDGDK